MTVSDIFDTGIVAVFLSVFFAVMGHAASIFLFPLDAPTEDES